MKKKHVLSAPGWLALFAASVLLIAAALAAFNVVTDPFGAFGDRFFTWWSYDETRNPRAAKISYLEEHRGEYDSYVIGCSSTSSFPVEDLNRVFDAKFYNLIMYGADMLDVERICFWLADNCEVKNLVLNVYIDNGASYGSPHDDISFKMPVSVSGEIFDYYKTYLFADPRYGMDKLSKRRTDSYLQAAHDVFDEKTGAYDKSKRDAEPIGSMERYLEAYPVFVNYDKTPHTLTRTEDCMKSVAAIRDLCAERGIRLTVVTAPVYYDYLLTFPEEQVREFYEALADTVPFWDFSVSSVSREPRYFYDETHFRNAAGTMAIARIAGESDVYVPGDYGVYVTPENARDVTARYFSVPEPDAGLYTADLPVLMYHHIAEESGGDGTTIGRAEFEEQLKALAGAGYEAVSVSDLLAYVENGAELPEKPVLITFDDGYASNREIGLPLLAEYGMKAVVFPIGISVGKDTYRDTGDPMTPHFTAEEAREMEGSGIFEIGSHGWDIHEVEGRDPAPIRRGILPREGESEADYIAYLRRDCEKMNEELGAVLGHRFEIFSYPYGLTCPLADVILASEGIRVSFTTAEGGNTIIRGLPQSLYGLRRINAPDYTGEELVERMRSEALGVAGR